VPHVIVRKQEAVIAEGNGLSSGPICVDRQERAILLTADCHIDKEDTKWWQVCPVLPLKNLENPLHNLVKRGKIFQFFHLPAHDSFPESFVDFSIVTTVSADLFALDMRVATLNDIGRRAFYAQFIRWVTRWDLRAMRCPECGMILNPTEALPVRPED